MNTHNMLSLLEQYSFNSHNIHKLISSEYFENKINDNKKKKKKK